MTSQPPLGLPVATPLYSPSTTDSDGHVISLANGISASKQEPDEHSDTRGSPLGSLPCEEAQSSLPGGWPATVESPGTWADNPAPPAHVGERLPGRFSASQGARWPSCMSDPGEASRSPAAPRQGTVIWNMRWHHCSTEPWRSEGWERRQKCQEGKKRINEWKSS